MCIVSRRRDEWVGTGVKEDRGVVRVARPVWLRLLWYLHREASATGVRFSTVIHTTRQPDLTANTSARKLDRLRSGRATYGTKPHCLPGILKPMAYIRHFIFENRIRLVP